MASPTEYDVYLDALQIDHLERRNAYDDYYDNGNNPNFPAESLEDARLELEDRFISDPEGFEDLFRNYALNNPNKVDTYIESLRVQGEAAEIMRNEEHKDRVNFLSWAGIGIGTTLTLAGLFFEAPPGNFSATVTENLLFYGGLVPTIAGGIHHLRNYLGGRE